MFLDCFTKIARNDVLAMTMWGIWVFSAIHAAHAAQETLAMTKVGGPHFFLSTFPFAYL